MEQTNRESALEAILFALGEPVEEERLAQALACTPQEAAEACQALAQRYVQTDAGLRLLRMEHRWQMVSAPQYGERIQTLLARKKPDKLSPAALETLALVASDIVRRVCLFYKLLSGKPRRALRFERNIRFFIEFLVDRGDLVMETQDGVTVYRPAR